MGIPLPREREFERGILVWIWDRRDVWVGLKPTERLQASRGRRQGRRTRRTKTLSEVNGEVRLKKRLTQPTLLEMSGKSGDLNGSVQHHLIWNLCPKVVSMTQGKYAVHHFHSILRPRICAKAGITVKITITRSVNFIPDPFCATAVSRRKRTRSPIP